MTTSGYYISEFCISDGRGDTRFNVSAVLPSTQKSQWHMFTEPSYYYTVERDSNSVTYAKLPILQHMNNEEVEQLLAKVERLQPTTPAGRDLVVLVKRGLRKRLAESLEPRKD